MNRIIKTCIASVVSEIQSSDIYLTVKARLFETPGANLNGVRVTPAFLSEIVQNQEKYVGLPLCADVKALAAGNYQHLGHLYDARTGEFHSAQIGSFYLYEEEPTQDGSALIGYARIMKRNKAVCRAISELFVEGALKFSFEISCGSYNELDDGTIEIDASEDNFLEGAAVVTFPACKSAVALDLVAELTDDGGESMTTDVVENSVVETAEEKAVGEQNVVAESIEEATVETASEEVASTEDDNASMEVASQEETAEVLVTDSHYEVHHTEVYDTDTGACSEQTVTVETRTTEPAVTYAEETAEKHEEEIASADSEEKEESDEDVNASCNKEKKCSEAEVIETAEENPTGIEQVIAELREEIASLRKELAELKAEPINVMAEVASAAAEVNPFIGEMSLDSEKKYPLLDSVEKVSSYTLL